MILLNFVNSLPKQKKNILLTSHRIFEQETSMKW